MVDWVFALSRRTKILTMLISDLFLLPLALLSAIALRLGTFDIDVSHYKWLFLILPIVTVPIFVNLGLYRSVVRYMDDKIITTIFYGVSLSVFVLAAVLFAVRLEGVPRSSLVIYWITAIAYITSSRFLAKGFLRRLEKKEDRRLKVAIYGAGRSGLQTVLALHSGVEYKPVAFFDDNKDLQGRNVVGIPVYDPKLAFKVMNAQDCHHLLIAMPSINRARRKEIVQMFEGKEIALKILPGMGDLVDGRVRIEDIRDVGVEDLLGRDPVPPFANLIESCIRDRAVMVTGAGGSIGSELCRQIIQNSPKAIVLFEKSEFALYKIEQELRQKYPSMSIHPILGDVLDKDYLVRILNKFKVTTFYHAAAYKHVPLVEANITAGVSNNVFGTKAAAEAALAAQVDYFVLISTDKAVRPTNIMGATKRLAELVLQALAKERLAKTRFTMVRFGNVLGSSGSVVPLFKEQIKHGGPITVTHPDVTRYFMTIPEAAQLVLQAGAMGQGGDVFVLDMGEPVKIVELAKKMITLSGLEVKDPNTGKGDIAIEFVGLRPGEKLYEELLIGDQVEVTLHPRIMRAEEKMIEMDLLLPALLQLERSCHQGDVNQAKTLIRELVVEYKPLALELLKFTAGD